MYEYADIVAYKPEEKGTHLKIFIPDKNLKEAIEKKRMRKCMIWMDDGRHISAEQRKMAYATINDIAYFTGYTPEEMKERLKVEHIVRTGCKEFSLSDCTMDTARMFINTMMDLALELGIQFWDSGINRTDDIDYYLYACLKHSKCAICGIVGEIHHVDTIGMGNNRTRIDDSDKRKICLCRLHHTEAHTIGMSRFEERYKVYGIKFTEEGQRRCEECQEEIALLEDAEIVAQEFYG